MSEYDVDLPEEENRETRTVKVDGVPLLPERDRVTASLSESAADRAALREQQDAYEDRHAHLKRTRPVNPRNRCKAYAPAGTKCKLCGKVH